MRTQLTLTRTLACALILGLTVGVAGMASASSIDPGSDLFATAPGAFVDLTGVGLGIVDLEGNPDPIGIGNTDTIVQRLDGIDPFNVGDSATIDIELVALSLISVDPVDLTPVGGGGFFDMFVTIDTLDLPLLPQPDPLPQSLGTMTISHDNADGGTFSSTLDVFANIIFTVLGGDPNDPNDIVQSLVSPMVTLTSTGTWSHHITGDFVVTEINHTGPHPVNPAVPEPSSLLLFGTGLVGFIGYRIRRKRLTDKA